MTVLKLHEFGVAEWRNGELRSDFGELTSHDIPDFDIVENLVIQLYGVFGVGKVIVFE